MTEKTFKGYRIRINKITANDGDHKLMTVSTARGALVGSRTSATETNTQLLNHGYRLAAVHSHKRR